MGTLTVGSIIDRCAKLLYDQTNIKWSRAELLDHLNGAQRMVAIASPSTLATVVSMKLEAGSRQSIPATGWLLLDVIRNMGVSGTTPGRAVRVISRRLLDAYNPNWQVDTAASSVTQSYWFDNQDQTSFFVYPPSNGQGYLEINYSNAPDNLTSEAQPITVPDVVDVALVNYVMFRALSKAADFSPGAQLAASYLVTFNEIMGTKFTTEQANSPNLGLMPPSAGTRGGTS